MSLRAPAPPAPPAPAPSAPRTALPRPALAAVLVGGVVAGAVALVQPLLGIGLALLALVATLLRGTRVARLAPILVVLAALAAIAGPNLAVPAAPWLFAFRVLIVLLGLGLVGYLLMDGRLALPSGLPRPAGLLGVLLAWSALSIGWAADLTAAARWTLFLAMMGGLAVGLAMLFRSRRRTLAVLVALGGAFVVACLVALVEVGTGLHLPSFRPGASRGGLFGAGSLFGNQNNFAIYLTLVLPYLAVLPIAFRDVRIKLLGIGGSLVALAFLLTTGSKSGLVATALIVGGLLVLVGSDRETRGRLAAAGGVAALAVAVIVPAAAGVGPIQLDPRIVTKLDFGLLESQVKTETGSGAVRASLLGDGLGLVEGTNGLGVGAGNAETRVSGLANFPGVGNLHNWWLEVLVNLGVVGLGLYVAFYLTLLRGQLRAARRSPDPLVRYLGLAGALALIGFVVGSLGPSTAIHYAPMWVTFGLCMGTLVLARAAAPSSSGLAAPGGGGPSSEGA